MTTTKHRGRHPPDEAILALRRRLRALSATTDLLHELMGFGHFQEMAMTRDGLLIGRPHRSDGFDAFIGSVTETMRQRTFRFWNEFNQHEQQLILQRLANQGIDPVRIGLPTDPAQASVSVSTASVETASP